MIMHKPAFSAFAFAIILAGALPGCATYSKCGVGGCAGDAKITADVRALIDQHPELGPPHSIDVQTFDHVVYLNGLVSDGMDIRTAESVALKAPGVTKVVNSLAVAH
jgi:osmotically-inducible protein OsmY